MRRLGVIAVLLALALLATGIWLRLPSRPDWGYALVDAYNLAYGSSSFVMGIDGVTLAAVILSRPLMWLFLGYAVAAAVGCGHRALFVSLLVLVGLLIACVAARQTVGVVLLGLTDISMFGGIVFVLPGISCVVDCLIAARKPATS